MQSLSSNTESLNLSVRCYRVPWPSLMRSHIVPEHWYGTQKTQRCPHQVFVGPLSSPLWWHTARTDCHIRRRIFHLSCRNVHKHPSKRCKLRGWGGGKGTGKEEDGVKIRVRGGEEKGCTVSAGGSVLPGNVTMSSPWEHRACRLFWTNRQLSRQW